MGWRILGWDVVDWELWLIAALVCLMIEFLTVDFSFLMIGGGALVGACIAAGSDSLAVQVHSRQRGGVHRSACADAHGGRHVRGPGQDRRGCVVGPHRSRIDPGRRRRHGHRHRRGHRPRRKANLA